MNPCTISSLTDVVVSKFHSLNKNLKSFKFSRKHKNSAQRAVQVSMTVRVRTTMCKMKPLDSVKQDRLILRCRWWIRVVHRSVNKVLKKRSHMSQLYQWLRTHQVKKFQVRLLRKNKKRRDILMSKSKHQILYQSHRLSKIKKQKTWCHKHHYNNFINLLVHLKKVLTSLASGLHKNKN